MTGTTDAPMATPTGRERVTAEEICGPLLRRSTALTAGCVWTSVLSLLAGPVAVYLLTDKGFWGSLGIGIGAGLGIAVTVFVVTMILDIRLTSRTVARFNRRFPIGPERDLAISALQQHRWQVTSVEATTMESLLKALGVPVPPAPEGVEGAPVEAQVAEALDTLAAAREDGAAAPPADPGAATPAPEAGGEPARRRRWGGVIPLEPETPDGRDSRTRRRRAPKKAGEETPP